MVSNFTKINCFSEGLALQTWRTSLVRVRRPSAVLMHPDVERPCKGVADKVSGKKAFAFVVFLLKYAAFRLHGSIGTGVWRSIVSRV